MTKVNLTESMGTKGIVSIELSKIVTGDFNPRKSIGENELRELAESIKQVGILQPVSVRPKGRKFEIVCGERRFRASVLADTKTIPAIVRKMSDDAALEFSIIENLQRKEVSPIEEAAACKRLADTGRYNVENLAVRFGKSETYIRKRMCSRIFMKSTSPVSSKPEKSKAEDFDSRADYEEAQSGYYAWVVIKKVCRCK